MKDLEEPQVRVPVSNCSSSTLAARWNEQQDTSDKWPTRSSCSCLFECDVKRKGLASSHLLAL